MFSTVLEGISGYFGKSFLISVFFPSLFFWMLNLALTVLTVGLNQALDWWGKQDGQVQGFLTAAFVIWTLFMAYVLHIFMPELSKLYEGRWRMLAAILEPMRGRNKKAWRAFRSQDEKLGAETQALKTRQQALEKLLNRDVPPLPYGERVDVSALVDDATALYDRVRDWHAEDYLADDRWQEMAAKLASIQARLLALSEDELAQHKMVIGPGSKVDRIFREPYAFLDDLIRQVGQQRLELYQEWSVAYPARLEWVMPTRLGNHLRAAETYSFLRYNLDAAVVWPRLRELLPDEFAGRLSEAKTNLSLMLVLTTLALVFGVVWGGVLMAVPDASLAIYKWVAAPITFLAGIGIARVAYLNAAQGALAYGELLKTAFDLYRWQVLQALHLELPPDLESERKLWGEIGGFLYRNYPFQTCWKHA
ncbi:MAG: hypothetical protein ACOYZ7_19765 [Chloroflexota bacterium]